MAVRQLHAILKNVRKLTNPPAPAGVTDGALLERFVGQRDEAAFELLVWRHGPMVMGVCRRLLGNEHDAEDAFQAVFFTLARKAGTITQRHSLGSWLYKVAYRICLRARATAAGRAAREVPLGAAALEQSAREDPDEVAWRELRPVLDAEVSLLPEKYRAAFVLCHLEGKTNAEAAEALGCPRGTVLSRLSRARQRLRERLRLRGLEAAAGALVAAARDNARALGNVAPVLVHGTVATAVLLAVGRLEAAQLPPAVAGMMEGAGALTVGKLKGALASLLVLLVLLGGGVMAYGSWQDLESESHGRPGTKNCARNCTPSTIPPQHGAEAGKALMNDGLAAAPR